MSEDKNKERYTNITDATLLSFKKQIDEDLFKPSPLVEKILEDCKPVKLTKWQSIKFWLSRTWDKLCPFCLKKNAHIWCECDHY